MTCHKVITCQWRRAPNRQQAGPGEVSALKPKEGCGKHPSSHNGNPISHNGNPISHNGSPISHSESPLSHSGSPQSQWKPRVTLGTSKSQWKPRVTLGTSCCPLGGCHWHVISEPTSHSGNTYRQWEPPLPIHMDSLDNIGHHFVPIQQPYRSPYYIDRDIWTSFSSSF